jgi:sensor histidine kinase YesM
MIPNYFNKYLFFLIPLVGIVIVGIFLVSYGPESRGESFHLMVHGLVMTAGLWLGCMAIVTFLWRRFPWEQAPLVHILLEIFLILFYTVIFSSTLYIIEKKYIELPQMENLGMEIFVTILITFFVTSIHESIFFYQQWKYNFSKSVRLEKDNIEARYEALRAQLNPHFLFNSLNGLTTMVEENKGAVEYIQNLSEMLRYMLKSGEKELVLLRDEIAILEKYIGLQQMRFQGSLEVRVDVDEKLYHLAVPPLSLQMLVENCIKHNVISSEKPLKIKIESGRESITVTNYLQKKDGVESSGHGLKNLAGRYRFFTPKKVVVSQSDNSFKVTIPLLQVEL